MVWMGQSSPKPGHSAWQLPAKRLGIKNRGQIKKGYKADIAVFEPQAVNSTWTIKELRSYAKGFEHVFVNGVQTIANGQRTENNGGEVLREFVS